jgi:hypothetical protein
MSGQRRDRMDLQQFWAPGVRASAAALVAGCVALLIYAVSANPHVGTHDVAELQSIAGTGGIAHAAYPTLVMLMRAVSVIPIGTLAWRVNALSGSMGAIAIGVLACVATRITRRAVLSVVAALAFGLSYTMWSESAQIGVHALTLAMGSIAFLALLRFLYVPSAWLALLIGVLVGLGLTSHMTILAFGLPLVMGLWMALRARTLRVVRVALMAIGLVAGLTPFAYTLEHDRPGLRINYMNDTFVPESGPSTPWAPTLQARGARLLWLLSGRQYFVESQYSLRSLPHRTAGLVTGEAVNEFPLPSLFIAAAGLIALLLAGGSVAVLAGMWMLGAIIATAKGGTMSTAEWFFLPGAWLLGLGLAVGLERIRERARGLAAITAVIVLALPLVRLSLPNPPGPLVRIGLVRNAWLVWPGGWSPLRHERKFEEFALAAAPVLPRDAIVLASWSPTGILRYALWAENRRPDVDVRFAPNGDGERWQRRWRQADSTGRPVFDADPPTAAALAGGRADSVMAISGYGLWRLHRPGR